MLGASFVDDDDDDDDDDETAETKYLLSGMILQA